MHFINNPSMSKALRKAVRHKLKLKNVYNKNRTEDNWANYRKQRNFCVNLLRKTKTENLQKLNEKDLIYNRKILENHRTIFFSNKGLNSNNLMQKENNRLITEEIELATVKKCIFTAFA